MRFKDFITRQRITIFLAGLILFVVSITLGHIYGIASLPGELLVDLAASAVTVIFTALIIDYLSTLEEYRKTQTVAGLAEDEVKAICFRIMWRMARLFGYERKDLGRDHISNRDEARDFLNAATKEIDDYLWTHNIVSDDTKIDTTRFSPYIERLEQSKAELEQALVLYEYALSYSLRERILNLRRELQVTTNLLGFVDDDNINEANISLVRVMSKSIYDMIQEVLEHDSRHIDGIAIHERESV